MTSPKLQLGLNDGTIVPLERGEYDILGDFVIFSPVFVDFFTREQVAEIRLEYGDYTSGGSGAIIKVNWFEQDLDNGVMFVKLNLLG